MHRKSKYYRYASVNFSCTHPPPPRQLWGICMHCQSRGSGISPPKGYPRAFDIHVVSDSKSKRRWFYRKRPVVCHWLACLSRTGPNCGGFQRYVSSISGIFSSFIKLQHWNVTEKDRCDIIMYFAFKTYVTISRGWGICSLLSSPPPGKTKQKKC